MSSNSSSCFKKAAFALRFFQLFFQVGRRSLLFLLLLYKCFPIFQLPSVIRLILEDFHDAQLLVSVSIQSCSEERRRWCEEGRLQLSDRWPVHTGLRSVYFLGHQRRRRVFNSIQVPLHDVVADLLSWTSCTGGGDLLLW